MYEKVRDAIMFASEVHKNQYSKLERIPYIFHLLTVASLVARITTDEDAITAGLLHDAAEDAGVSLQDIREHFGERVFTLVSSETEDKRTDLPPSDTWIIRKQESLEELRKTTDIGVKTLWLCDKLANITSMYNYYKINGDKLWENFHQKDPAKHKWYYSEVLENTKELSDTQVYKDFKNIFRQLFGGKES